MTQTAVELADAIRRGERSPLEAVDEQIELIERIDPWLNAVVVRRFEEARAEARAAERAPATGPLHGVPVTVKEALEMEGLPFTNGSLLEADVTGGSDAPAVRRLRGAGAIVLGKTNLSEFCCFYDSDNLVYGRTVNPHDPERTPGGSSGGEAAAVAAGLSYLGAGSDLGSSIRQPAAWCGVFGLKPTRGLVSNVGHAGFGIPPAFGMFACVGPLARSAADLELGLRAMATAEPAPARSGPLAVGVYEEDGMQAVASSCRQAVRRAADALAAAGHELAEAAPPRQAEARDAYDLMLGSEIALYMPELVGAREEELSRYGREMVEQLRGFSPGLAPVRGGRPHACPDRGTGVRLVRAPPGGPLPDGAGERAARRGGHRRDRRRAASPRRQAHALHVRQRARAARRERAGGTRRERAAARGSGDRRPRPRPRCADGGCRARAGARGNARPARSRRSVR